MDNEQKKQIVKAAIAAFNDRDLEKYLAYHTDDATSWEVYFPEPINLQESIRFIPEYWQAFPDAKVETQRIYVDGDTVIAENIVTGTLLGPFLGNRPTGKSFCQREGVIFELRGGKIAAVRIYLDRRTQEEQLGLA